MQIATGTYVGDGTDGRRIVTGLSGRLREVRIYNRTDLVNWGPASALFKVADMPGAQSVFLDKAGSNKPDSDDVTFDGADFIVDFTIGSYNAPGATFYWTAWSE